MKDEYDFSNAKRGAIIPPEGKTRLGIYLDTDMLDVLREQAEKRGMGRQTLINEVLTAHTSIDTAVLEKLKQQAEQQGIGYQQLINDVLAAYVESRAKRGSREDYSEGSKRRAGCLG